MIHVNSKYTILLPNDTILIQVADNQHEKIERLITVRKALKLTQDELASKLNINRANLSAIENFRENRRLPNGTKYILEKEYNVNPDWFDFGIGEIFLRHGEIKPYETNRLSSSINLNENNNYVAEPVTEYQKLEMSDSIIGVPIYNMPASASNVELYADANDLKVVGHLGIPGATRASFGLPIYGHSMYPTLANGYIAVLRPIEKRDDIEWGSVYYVEYGDYRVFKRLLKNDDDPETVILWSDNSEMVGGRPKYAPKIIKAERIRKLCLLTDILQKPNY